jgi:hypothetical protein
MKLIFSIEIEPGERADDVQARAEAWLERTGRDSVTNAERLVDRLVTIAGINVSEKHPDVEVGIR